MILIHFHASKAWTFKVCCILHGVYDFEAKILYEMEVHFVI